MDQAGIPKRRQATPQAPPRDFKPRKNGTPAVPSTPPANVPRAMPQPAPQITPPPMQGAQRSMGQSPAPVQRQKQAPPQQQARRSGGFNPMQGPMGANVERARQAAASMYEVPVQRQTPSMPQAAQQPRMQQPMQRAPKQAPAQRIERAAPATPAQEAALSMFGPMQAMSGESPQQEYRPGTKLQFPEVPYGQMQAAYEATQGEPGGDDGYQYTSKFDEATQDAFKEAYAQNPDKLAFANDFIEKFGLGEFVALFGWEGLEDVYGEQEKRPYSISEEALKSAVESGEYTNVGPESVPDSLIEALKSAVMEGLIGESEGLYTDEEMEAQAQAVIGQADEAKAALAQQMAMRGMGASGLYGSGFGNIDSQLIDTLNDLALQNKALGTEVDLKKLGISATALANMLQEESRRSMFDAQMEYQKSLDDMSNRDIYKQNIAAALGAKKWDAQSSALVSQMMDAKVPWSDIEELLTVRPGGVVSIDKSGAFELLGTPEDERSAYQSSADEGGMEAWALDLLNNPERLEEEGTKAQLNGLYEDWKNTVPSDMHAFVDSPEEWLDYYFGAPPSNMDDEALDAWWAGKEAAERQVALEYGYAFSPPGLNKEKYDELSYSEKTQLWNSYWALQGDMDALVDGPWANYSNLIE